MHFVDQDEIEAGRKPPYDFSIRSIVNGTRKVCDISRKELNQAVFAHLYVDDDEIVASDLKPAFQRLLSSTLEADLKTERKTEQTTRTSTKNLWIVPEVAESTTRGETEDNDRPQDLPARARRTAPTARLGAFLALERPRGRLPWEKHNRGPRKDRGWDLTILVGFDSTTWSLIKSELIAMAQIVADYQTM